MILQDAFGLYLSSLAGLSQKTVATHRSRLRQFVFGWEGEVLPSRAGWCVTAVTEQHIHDHFLALRLAGGKASGTLAGYKASHRAFWSFCCEEGWLTGNPADVLLGQNHQYSYDPVHRLAIPRQALADLIAGLPGFVAARAHSFSAVRDAALVSLVADSAGRRGEIHSLQVPAVRRVLQAGGRVLQGWGKTGSARIRFGDESVYYLGLLLDRLPSDSQWLWVSSRSGKRLRPDTLSLNFAKVCQEIGLPPYRPHSTRKRTVTDIIEQTGDPKVGQLLANHTDPRTSTVWYNEVTQDRVAAEVAKLAKARRQADLADEFASFFGSSTSAE